MKNNEKVDEYFKYKFSTLLTPILIVILGVFAGFWFNNINTKVEQYSKDIVDLQIRVKLLEQQEKWKYNDLAPKKKKEESFKMNYFGMVPDRRYIMNPIVDNKESVK